MTLELVHRVSIPVPGHQLVHVETTIQSDQPLPSVLVVFMPVWTPGSYLVREYARHLEGFSVEPPATSMKLRKNAWRIESAEATRLVVQYRVYAGELTVRTNHVDEAHAFLVGAALFVAIEGCEELGSRIEIEVPASWQAATALSCQGSENFDETSRHRFTAPDYDTLVDCPIELGMFRQVAFEVCGVPHRYALWPADAVSVSDAERLVDDTKIIISHAASLFGGTLPYDSYDLLLHISPRGRGGLEHRSSAALIAPPSSFASREDYLDLLSLVAHEVFHAWNVKRIRPEGLTPYRYQSECYTRLLWWFEGATSYYDWRLLVLTGRASIEEYLDHLAGEIAYLEQTPGRRELSLESASFDAWIKLYRPDENSLNSSVSYYRKGELVCALLDLELRTRTGGRATLDHVLGHLWRHHGISGIPVPEDGMQAIFEEATEVFMGDLFDSWIRSPSELDVERVLAPFGLALERVVRPQDDHGTLGLRAKTDGGHCVVAAIVRDGPAFAAGITAGDELLAIGGDRIDSANGLEAALRRRAPQECVEVLSARDGRIHARRVTLGPPLPHLVRLSPQKSAPLSARKALAAWLGRSHPAWSSPAL